MTIGTGRCSVNCGAALISGEGRCTSGPGRLAKADIPLNKFGSLSLEPARVRAGGGGGKACEEPGSGDDLYIFTGEALVAGDAPEDGSSLDIVDVC